MRIVTHNGVFHADEVFAVATLSVFTNTPISDMEIIRTRDAEVIEEAQADANVYVIDVGLQCNHEMKNFDHHQAKHMVASNLLVFSDIGSESHFSNKLATELLPFYNGISNYDINANSIIQNFASFDVNNEYRLVSHIISGFNRSPMSPEQDTQFLKAVEFAISILENEIHAANERIAAQAVWNSREELAEGKVLSFDVFCPIWKDKANDTVLCAVMETGGKFGITSIDSGVWSLPDADTIKGLMSDPSQFIFVHASGFTAGFKTKEAAVEVALKLV